MIPASPPSDGAPQPAGDAADPLERAVPAPLPGDECWRRIGVSGDRSCPELVTHVHCRNCPVMAAAARTFFDRAAPEGYLSGWVGILEESAPRADADPESLLVFRLGREWLALPTTALVEVTTSRPCHRVPHRVGGVLEGIVNIRGQLQLCVSAHRLLGIDEAPRDTAASAFGEALRLLVVERRAAAAEERWVFAADDVAGVHRVERTAMRMVPSTVSQSGARYCRALFDWQEGTVGVLDDTRFFDSLSDHLATA